MYALQSPFLTLNLYVLKKIKGGGISGAYLRQYQRMISQPLGKTLSCLKYTNTLIQDLQGK